MRRKSLLRGSVLSSAAAVLALSLPAGAQLSTVQLESWVNLPTSTSHIGNITGNAKAGAGPYRRYCVGCHGELGDGNGENATWLDPKPRDFQLAIFKCRSTPSGTLPTDEDLFDTIARGLDRSVMPPWDTFTKDERADLVAWIKHFSPRWQKEKPGTPIQIPSEPEITAERIKTGQDLFGKLQCWRCHGVQGTANGPAASTLTDDQGRLIVPYDFADGSRPKCGSTDRDLYKIFMTGLDGTPMPSYSDNIKPDDAWDLVFYLRTLQPRNAYNAREIQIAKQLGLKPVTPQ
jgi:mono/diheme cytochrome c family protein